MRRFILLSFISTLSTSVMAVNPVQGFYAGILGEVSHAPTSYPIVFSQDLMLFHGTVHNSSIGGGAGGVLGYRIKNFHLQGEILYNYVTSATLTVDNCTLQSPFIQTPVGFCSQDRFQADRLGFNGNNTALYALFNVLYDITCFEDETTLVPYVGLGIGEARITKRVNFINSSNIFFHTSHGNSLSLNGAAAQGIIGVSFYLDDYAWIGVDYRHLRTRNQANVANSAYALNTLNFSVNASFDNSADEG